MKVVTVATDSEGYYPLLRQSCKRYGVSLTVLGWKTKWKGPAHKLWLMKEFLDKEEDDELICFVDAFDVLLVRDITDLEILFYKLYDQTGKPIIMGNECIVRKWDQWMKTWIRGTVYGKSINGGTYIGLASALRSMLYEICPSHDQLNQSDHVLLARYARQYPHQIHIDSDGQIFVTCANPLDSFSPKELEIRQEGKKVTYQHHRPFFLHGTSATNMNDVAESLGYHIGIVDRHRIELFLQSSYQRHVKGYIWKLVPYFIIFLLLMVLVIYYIKRA